MFVVGDLLRWNRRRYPDKIAVIDEAGQLTWRELVDRAWALAQGLADLGVGPGDKVGVLTGNSTFAAETYLGIVASGATCVQYNNLWAEPELVHGINLTHARVILVEEPYVEKLAAAQAADPLPTVEHVIAQGPAYEAFLGEPRQPDVELEPADPNVIIFTGGTTGFSKGVVLSHRSVLANAFDEIVDTDMEHDDRTLIIAPMFHSASLLCWFLPHMVLGATAVFQRKFDEEETARIIARHGVTNGFFVPNMVRRMLISGAFKRHDLSSCRRIYVGGATFRMPDKEAIKDVLPNARIYYQYGLTEAGPIVTRLRPEDMYRTELDGSIGREFLLNEVTLRDPATGEEVPPGEVGEICVRGPNVMTGYYDNEAATETALADGWLHTGDLATRNDEGYLFYHDRLKDMIKTGGENVYSQEVERVIYRHPAVAEAAVIGVPSSEWDEEVRAVVALRPGHELSEADLRQYCRAELAAYKIPKRVVFIALADMPVNPSGKIIKTELRTRNLWEDPEVVA